MACRVVSTISCIGEYPNYLTVCISNDGNVYSFGKSRNKGHGHYSNLVFPPKMIPSLSKIVSVVCGAHHTVCLNDSGVVFTFGSNRYGELGIGKDRGEIRSSSIPQKVNLPPIKGVSCGTFFTICLSTDGNIYSFGLNEGGELGLGNNNNYNSPQQIPSLHDIDFVECGNSITFCKSLENEVYAWGSNYYGQLGLGNMDEQLEPVKCEDWPDDVVDIKCGDNHTLVLTSNQKIYSCGFLFANGREEKTSSLHQIEELSNIIRIECGSIHSMCIDVDYNLFVFGYVTYGQLGLGDTRNRYQPVKHPSLSNIIDMSKGGNHTFVKTSNNEIYAFGNNEFSQIGIKTETNNQLTPIRVFEDNEDIWCSNINKSKAKSARF